MKKTSSNKLAAGLGIAALTAGAAAAAGVYFSGKNGKKQLKKLSGWSKQAMTEMEKRTKGMKGLGKKAYDQAAKEVLAKYKQAKNIDPKEIAQFGKELKSHWDKISKDLTKLTKKTPVKARPKSPKKKIK